MSKNNALTVISRFWILAFLCSLPFSLPAILAGVLSLPFVAVIALLVALLYNGIQWLGHRLLFGGTPEYEDFKAQGKDAWFDHSAPWPFRPDDECSPSSEVEPRARWRCEVCHAEVFDLDQPCWNCGVEWLCPICHAPVADEFSACDHCGNNPLGK
ncbi:hypothetical protein DTL42_14225 [Bremerella cremea]|uniref:Zinc ribbon domain-containing protein n=1 Tax=Bremerella cremea TaxID=1031537 RepID=A0A368KTE9_9BACT|nr:hypothetical protein [Bremerella cremea]RCS47672.1 hypothetical protein DTL42_14225 [Bremerella cremea]